MKTKRIIIEVIGGCFIALFLFAGILKWIEMGKFTGQMERMPFWDWAAPLVAYGLPTTLLMLAVLFIAHKYLRFAFILSTSIMLAISIFIILILTKAFGPGYPCSCAGILGMSWKEHLWFNLAFVAIGITAIILLYLPQVKAVWSKIWSFKRWSIT